MEPTLDVGQRVLVNRFIYHFTDPKIGDIVVFHPPQGAEGGAGGECGDPRTGAGGSSGAACDQPTPEKADVNFIKRIVAGPGGHAERPERSSRGQREDRPGGLHQPLHARRSLQFAATRSPSRPTITS